MGEWYTIGLTLGLGVGVGVLLAALAGAARTAVLAAVVLAAAAGTGAGLAVDDWTEAVAAAVEAAGAPRRRSSRGRSAAAARAPARPRSSGSGDPPGGRRLRACRLPRALAVPASPRACADACRATRTSARCQRRPEKLILVVIDGLTPAMLENVIERRATPWLAFLADHGSYRRAVSTFPSLTPVCLASIATGAHGDVHEIPHLVWWHRGRQRLVEYGSSWGAIRAAGARRSIMDTVFTLNAEHLGKGAVTVYESLEDAGLVPAAVNITCYRGRTPHRGKVPGFTRPVLGPRRFFFYSLIESDPTGAPLAWRNRPGGTIDGYATAVARWLVTRDGFDFLVYYLSDYDYASHEHGPDAAHDVLARCDEGIGTLIEAAGGPDEFLERYAVIVCSDHGQTSVTQAATLQERYAGVPGTLVTASNRAGMLYRLPGCREDERESRDGSTAIRRSRSSSSARASRRSPAATAKSSGSARRRRVGYERRRVPARPPNGLERSWAALANPNVRRADRLRAEGGAADLAGRHHVGGGSRLARHQATPRCRC